ncbi:DUF2997 domain-containing protein [Gloeobacter kilaueensis]|uniref:DUF2997 domain-containing protein n=1 Tax=Gloeobacter kilaueensis (strain ATCC BAA-2537 / CCAP 1431/1 / ULC 316 / JS1) TaxID=1183438 RepID=U5QK29_GLOK1|nr:DUF2997 domain-containing protein [Gloeobacter kilaueensis]AGY59302.1 hypothetical protein GKIL_3056 [Gloeobacter kilaueensis JS1]
MAEYQRIEFVIGKDGRITEQVSGAVGSHCTEITAALENALGRVEKQELTSEYDGAAQVSESLPHRLDQGNA